MSLARARVVLMSIVLGATSVVSASGPALGVEPIDLRDEGASRYRTATLPVRPRVTVPAPPRTTRPAPTVAPSVAASPSPAPTTAPPTPRPTPPPEPEAEVGLDVSYPQCGKDLPDGFDFAVVGVNGGRVYRANPCLGADGDAASQLEWAGRDVELYANTGNPGPDLSEYWPDGQVQPRECREEGLVRTQDTWDCAYLYGWNAAADAYETAVEAFVSVGWAADDAERLPWPTTWWLDVETANSWRLDPRLNVASLEGARDFLESVDVEEIGFYSTPRMWLRITGATTAFADHPAWHAGAEDLEDAVARCEEGGFTGGELRMVQWVEDGLDHNVRCD